MCQHWDRGRKAVLHAHGASLTLSWLREPAQVSEHLPTSFISIAKGR